jgi:dTDP-glucose 4,6-dehydratase
MSKKTILLTGCAGFIGSNFVKSICLRNEVRNRYNFVILDALTYAGHYPNISSEIESNDHLTFFQQDIRDTVSLREIFRQYQFDGIIHFAAESHVDRSIDDPNIFVETNVIGTLNLLKSSLLCHEKNTAFRFVLIGTDEVYGSLGLKGPPFVEDLPLRPNSPYSASKASADLLARSFFKTYKLPIIITRCSNNYGPFQYPEKLIPLMITNAQDNRPLPVYGQGLNVRDWIYVDDHNEGVWQVFEEGRAGEIYNLGGQSEIANIDLVKMILDTMGKDHELITYVPDRPGHDFRYAMNFDKIRRELGWKPRVSLAQGLERTIAWYMSNKSWTNLVKQKISTT